MFGHYLRLNNRVLYCMALWIGAIFRWWGILRVVSEMPTQEVHRILACISESRPTRPSIPYAFPDAKFCFGGFAAQFANCFRGSVWYSFR